MRFIVLVCLFAIKCAFGDEKPSLRQVEEKRLEEKFESRELETTWDSSLYQTIITPNGAPYVITNPTFNFLDTFLVATAFAADLNKFTPR